MIDNQKVVELARQYALWKMYLHPYGFMLYDLDGFVIVSTDSNEQPVRLVIGTNLEEAIAWFKIENKVINRTG